MSTDSIEEWLDRLSKEDVDESTTSVCEFAVTVNETSCFHDANISQTLYVDGTDLVFERRGLKEISYDQWVGNNWFEWEFVYNS